MKRKFMPWGPRVLVRPVDEEQIEGGVIVPDAAKDKPLEGVVIEVTSDAVRSGEAGLQLLAPPRIGLHVAFGKFSGTEIKLNGEKLIVLSLDEILGVFISVSDEADRVIVGATPTTPAPEPRGTDGAQNFAERHLR